MAYKNAYVSHPDQEIDYDIIFGRDTSQKKRKEKLRGAVQQKSRYEQLTGFLKNSIGLVDNSATS